jgi:hypothetical protein
MQKETAPTLFFETQQFRNHFFWLILLLAPVIYFLSLLIYQIKTGELVGDHPSSNLEIGFLLFSYSLLAYYALNYVKLLTIINKDKIWYGWNLPTDQLNCIEVAEIKSCEIIHYSFVGFGYRLSFKYGVVYNVWGNKGLLIEKKNGKKVLIGTQNSKQLKETIEQLV